MSRIVIIGNAGGGKSTLARTVAQRESLRHVEIDRLLWREGWQLTPVAVYERQHADIVASDNWVMDGLGRRESIPSRLERATKIVLIDMPLWTHFWLAAERQIAWVSGKLVHPPGGVTDMPQTRALFQSIWNVEQTWMPEIRALVVAAEARGIRVVRLADIDDLTRFGKRT